MGLWTDIEDALHTWVKKCTDFTELPLTGEFPLGPDAEGEIPIIWSEQTGARVLNEGYFVTLRLGAIIPLGAFDQVETNTDLLRGDGNEIEIRVVGQREFVASVQVFSKDPTGDKTARAIASKIQLGLVLPSIRVIFEGAGISAFDAGTIQNLTALTGTEFESRALLEVRFYTIDSLSEYTGFIETVEAVSYFGPPDEGTRDFIDI